MSADNGVYILCSPKTNEQSKIDISLEYEYRIAHCTSIEDIYDEDIGDYCTVINFADSKIFKNEDEAFMVAKEMAIDIKKDFGILEYGICFVDYKSPFPIMTKEEARKKMDEFWKSYKKKDKP